MKTFTKCDLSKPRSNVRFSPKVKEYLTARLTIGERTGRKANPGQVAADTRNAKNESNECPFTRSEWLSKNQVQSFFSRMSAAHRKEQEVGLSTEKEEDIQCLPEYSEREDLMNTVNKEINVAHPICFDSYDLCERYHSNTLQEFNVAMLRSICNHFEIPVKSRDKMSGKNGKTSNVRI